MPLTLRHLAEQLKLEFEGDADLCLTGVASLANARSGDLCFLQHEKYLRDIDGSDCSALILSDKIDSIEIDRAILISSNPQLSFAQAIALVCPDRINRMVMGIHPSAQIAESVILGEGVSVGALCTIGEGVVIGAGSQIGAGCVIEDRVRIGDRCLLHANVVIGSDGFGLVEDNQQWVKVPQIGSVVLGNDVEIGANTTVDRGALDDTVIEDGCKLDNLIQVAHNVRIGAHTAIAACVGIAGSAIIGRNCKIGGAAVVLGHLSIVDNVMVTAMSLVTKDIKNPGVYSSGTPLMENSEWHKNNARYKSLDKLARTVTRLDKLVAESDNQ
ncbi:MAG: UDP-3-O-(3-hydroxymyristoyl)glucosamine N-acyltransferase [Gammaproteobacteria bacterium]|nr:UDP-3-O-(3-hydroxymyristoyl)glucosamine N-acyltransferase [Gammaproteobacteria bacterium]